jgi:hypothetical protein
VAFNRNTEIPNVAKKKIYAVEVAVKFKLYLCLIDRLCGLVVRVPGYRTRCIVFPVKYELNLYMLCRRH